MEKDAGIALTELRVDGGAAANNLLMQFQADILGVPVVRPKVLETTALGAAYLAGLAVGYWASTDDIGRNWRIDRRFEPAMDPARRDASCGRSGPRRWSGPRAGRDSSPLAKPARSGPLAGFSACTRPVRERAMKTRPAARPDSRDRC